MYYNRWAPPPDELYHFGVKGMRWGVRKDRIATHRKTYTTFGANRQDKSLGQKHRIPKGTKMYRTTTNAGESNEGSTYVSYQTADRKFYRAWVASNAGLKDQKKAYEKTYELTEDLLIPSRDEVKQAYQDAVKAVGKKTVEDAFEKFLIGDRVIDGDIKQARKDKTLYEKFSKTNNLILSKVDPITGETKYASIKRGKDDKLVFGKDGNPIIEAEMTERQRQNAQAYYSAATAYHSIMKLNKDKYLSDFALGMGTITKNPKVKDHMIKTLTAKGYNAIVDEAGVGSISSNGKTAGREGQETLIVFDKGKSLKETKSKELSDRYSRYGYRNDVQSSKEALRRMRAREAI